MSNKQHNRLADKIITVDDIMDHEPCDYYPEARVRELIGGGKTALEILDLPIPAEDRLWVLSRPGLLPMTLQDEWALRYAGDVSRMCLPDEPGIKHKRTEYTTVKQRWLRGEVTDEQLTATIRLAWISIRVYEKAMLFAATISERSAANRVKNLQLQIQRWREILTGGTR